MNGLIGYVRVSTEEQVDSGLGLAAQRQRIEAYCLATGCPLLRIEEDAGISGKVAPDKRPALARALDAVKRQQADGIIAVKLDRFSRYLEHVLALMKSSVKDEWQLVSVSDHIDTSSAMGRAMVALQGVFAQLERETIGERTSAAMQEIARQGRANGRFTKFGWRNADGGFSQVPGDRRPLVACEVEQVQAGIIRNARAAGRSYGQIARQMAMEGCVHGRSANKIWNRHKVRAICDGGAS